MESTLATVKQMFNAKTLASGKTVEQLVDGDLAIFEAGSTTSLAANATVQKAFYLVGKNNGKLYYSFSDIAKANMIRVVKQDYKAQVANTWETVIESCNILKGILLNIHINETSLMMRDGLTWSHRDFFVEVKPEQLRCFTACDGKKPVYENHVFTMLVNDQIQKINSPFYTAEVRKVSDDTVVTDVKAFVETNKAANTGDDPEAYTTKLKLVIKGKLVPAGIYHDFEANYVYPRGVALTPVLTIDGNAVPFTETQALVYELGAGYDLRAEEMDTMSLYTNLNHMPKLACGPFTSPDLVFQFENNVNYNVINFEYTTDNIEPNSGRKRLFGVLIGVQTTAVYTAIKNALGIA